LSADRPAPGATPARAILVGVDFGGRSSFDASLDELAQLAESAGDIAVERVVARRKAPDPAFFVGSGKADELRELVQLHQAEAVIFDQALSPAQQRNLERHLGVAVADRTMLILEIFGDRARSHEGKLQVDLARLQYLSTRLVRRWSHLERQRGGIGNRGGPGEAQIELDRRMIGERIKSIKKQLERVKRQRGTQRRARERNDTFRISLVGYTNAGKSTLFNALAQADVFAADQLFATLDTTTRKLRLDGVARSVSISDTVGFIRDLPHALIDAFSATLQEAAQADLLLHVVDGSSDELAAQFAEVQRVLAEIGAGEVPQIVVFNKLDRLADTERPRALVDSYPLASGENVPRIFVSARAGEGVALLKTAIVEAISGRSAPGVDLNAEGDAPSGEHPSPNFRSPEPDAADEPARDGTYHSHA